MASVLDVAAYILRKAGPMTAMKLQKLCYYSQAWSLVWDEAPIFDEPIEAWANGPVVPELFRQHRGSLTISAINGGEPQNLSFDQQQTVDVVLATYNPYTAQQLSELTHSESPWILARRGLGPTDRGNVAISLDEMQDFYGSLLEREDAQSL